MDEYQDINAAQDKIIAALSRDGADANRFLVGDVKQSIYRFRLADPKIFRDYAHDLARRKRPDDSALGKFSQPRIASEFREFSFRPLMREEIGGVDYDDEAKLKFGSPRNPRGFQRRKRSCRRARNCFCVSKPDATTKLIRTNESGANELADLDESEKEARLLAMRLMEFKQSQAQNLGRRRKNIPRRRMARHGGAAACAVGQGGNLCETI